MLSIDMTGIRQACDGGSGNAAYYVAVAAAANTAQSLSRLTSITAVQTNDYLYLVYF